MDISALLNPASPPGTNRDASATSGESQNPRVQQQPGHNFSPRHDQHNAEAPLLHPQPVRPVMTQSSLGSFGVSRYLPQPQLPIRSPAGPIQQMFTPEHQHRAEELEPHTARPDPYHPAFDTSAESINRVFSWQIGDPIPPGMRLTVPSYVTIREPPPHQRILIPENESAESLRPFLERPIPLRRVGPNGVFEGSNLPEHHSALMRMQEPTPIPFTHPITMPQRPGAEPRAGDGPPAGQASATELQKKIQDARPSIDQTMVANTTKEVVLVEFEQVVAHTAKCDLCNARNKAGMSRCLSCGWQSCHACTIARGCFRTHHAGGRIHTGPVEKDDLVAPEKAKPNKGGKLRVLKDTATKKTRKYTRKAAGGGKSRKSSGTSSVGIGKEDEKDSGSEREALLAGARNLYALGVATLEAMKQEEAEADNSRLNEAKAAQHGDGSDGDSPDSDPADPDYEPMQIDPGKPVHKSTRRVTR